MSALVTHAVKGLSGHSSQTLNKPINSVALLGMDFRYLPLSSEYEALIGKPSEHFKLLVYGKPGQGKSTFSIGFAGYLAKNHGKVLYITGEEHGMTLKEKVKRLKIAHSNLTFAFSLNPTLIASHRFIVIDSLNALNINIHTFRNLINQFPDKAWIFIQKSGKRL